MLKGTDYRLHVPRFSTGRAGSCLRKEMMNDTPSNDQRMNSEEHLVVSLLWQPYNQESCCRLVQRLPKDWPLILPLRFSVRLFHISLQLRMIIKKIQC